MIPQVLPGYVLTILKVLVLLGIGVYGLFAAVLVRQEHLMEDVLEEAFESIIRLLVIIHLAAAVGLFVLALVIL